MPISAYFGKTQVLWQALFQTFILSLSEGDVIFVKNDRGSFAVNYSLSLTSFRQLPQGGSGTDYNMKCNRREKGIDKNKNGQAWKPDPTKSENVNKPKEQGIPCLVCLEFLAFGLFADKS